jgi:hypothetical protein
MKVSEIDINELRELIKETVIGVICNDNGKFMNAIVNGEDIGSLFNEPIDDMISDFIDGKADA